MVSCINISMCIQIYGPGPIKCDAGWKFVIHFDLTGISIPKVNASRAEKLPLFPGYYFLMMSSTCNARSNLSAPEPLYPWTGKDELYWILMSTRRGGDFSYAGREEIEDDGEGVRGSRRSKVSREKQTITSARAPELFKTAQTYSD